ncbi:phenylacetate--CoA ligase PaaK [Caenimonas sp. SL110]|uniref:phenylacetate--CoA ligase PaaK n=1 Tax=Caenimonas sp. SL110 TaxID=1450524 RepID=UPI00065427C4|nr:phenylacetate--CoA ligase PaaK [Caenimonas sp. SL110]
MKSPRVRPEGLEPIETASVDELRALQLQRLKKSLRHAYDNMAPYRTKCEAQGVHPDDLGSLADLAKFPFTTKQDFRDNYPFGMFAVPTEQLSRIHASSGTTGKPVVVGYTAKDIDTWANLVARTLRAAGVHRGDKVHVAYGYGLFTGGLGSHYGAERLGCTVIPMSGGQTEKQVQMICDFDPDIIMVTPSYLLNIADAMERQRIDTSRLRLRAAVVGAEPWTESMRLEINGRMNLRALDTYGLSEIIGPGVAQECIETEDGPTLWEDHFYPEVIDPETGEVLPEGSEGELVLTCLTKEALPTIRYRTRDLTRLLPGTARTMRRLGKVMARSDDMLIVRGVNMFPSQIEEQLLAVHQLAPHFQLELMRDGSLDQVKVFVEPRVVGDKPIAAGAELARRIKAHVGVSVHVEVLGCGEVPRSEGKAVRVIDHRTRN